MWTYEQKTGWLIAANGMRLAQGYSGHDADKNRPECQSVKGMGPIPCGFYTIGTPHDTATHGPFVMPLTPDATDQEFGRGGFLMHGDSIPHPGTASLGCIIQPRFARENVWNSGDHRLQVISGESEST